MREAAVVCCKLAIVAVMLASEAATQSGGDVVRVGRGGGGGGGGESVCGDCNQGQCPPLGECPGGITWDSCGCCEVCAKTLGEECGGPYSAYGQCGLGLTCLKDSRECPYLLHTQRSFSNGDICKQYLFNAIGRCVQERRLRIRGFSLLKG